MFVLKRDGRKEPIMFDKITARIRKLNYGLKSISRSCSNCNACN